MSAAQGKPIVYIAEWSRWRECQIPHRVPALSFLLLLLPSALFFISAVSRVCDETEPKCESCATFACCNGTIRKSTTATIKIQQTRLSTRTQTGGCSGGYYGHKGNYPKIKSPNGPYDRPCLNNHSHTRAVDLTKPRFGSVVENGLHSTVPRPKCPLSIQLKWAAS